MTKKQIRIIISISFIILFAISMYVADINEKDRRQKLQNSIITKAVLTYVDKYTTKGYGAYVTFEVKGEKIEEAVNCDCRKLNIGDTVLIRYTVDDPTIVRMVDKYYEINKGFQKNPKE